MTDRQRLRLAIRTLRREQKEPSRITAAQAVAQRLCRHRLYRQSAHIGLFIANDGELSPQLVARRAAHDGKYCYLPVLRPDGRLAFVRYRPGVTTLWPNPFGIAEPRYRLRDVIPPAALDLVLVPLVAFDRQGNRLGMGGGFYDRTFAFKQRRKRSQRPVLVGIAWDMQRLQRIETKPWDVALGTVVTERELRLFRH